MLAGSVANLANAAIGGGVLAFPLAFMSCGYIIGFAVSFGFAAIMGFTLHILGMASEVSRATSYQGLVRALLGPTAGKIISVSMTIYLFGSCIAYLNIISDQIFESILSKQASLEGTVLANRQFVIFCFTVFVVAPLCLLRSVKSLEITSALAVFSIVFLAADVVYHAADILPKAGIAASAKAFPTSAEIFQAVPIICFALQCHLVYVPVFAGLSSRSLRRMDWVTVATFVVCLALYLPVGVLGYLMYGADTKDDISENLPEGIDTYVVHACLSATAIFSFPLLHYVARIAVGDLVWGDGAGDAIVQGTVLGPESDKRTLRSPSAGGELQVDLPDNESLSAPLSPARGGHTAAAGGPSSRAACPSICGTLQQRMRSALSANVTYYALTAAFIAATMGVSMALKGIKLVLGFTGSTAAVVQIFIFPGFMYMKMKQVEQRFGGRNTSLNSHSAASGSALQSSMQPLSPSSEVQEWDSEPVSAPDGMLRGGALIEHEDEWKFKWDLDLTGAGSVVGWSVIGFGVLMGGVSLGVIIAGIK